MHRSIAAIVLLCLFGCTTTPEPREELPVPDTPEEVGPAGWTGYYSGSTADEEVSLWVRPDSMFILQRKLIGQDSVPEGTFGRWHPRGNEIELCTRTYVFEVYKADDRGTLQQVEGEGSSGGPVLERLADAIGDAVPRMRVSGTYVLVANAQSFKPCDADHAWPCVGGMDLGEEEGETMNGFSNEDLLNAYRKAVAKDGDPWELEVICTLGLGPAMEGEGSEEYLFIESVTGRSNGCP